MKYFGITFFAGFVFLATAFFAGALAVSPADVSRETSILERYRETFTVKQGVSQDGSLVITLITTAPSVPPQIKSANHTRTLRAFLAPDRGGVLILYVESVKPHEYYALTGGFTIAGEYPVLTWVSETTLAFYGRSGNGQLMNYIADLHVNTLTVTPIDPSLSLPTRTIPQGDILP